MKPRLSISRRLQRERRRLAGECKSLALLVALLLASVCAIPLPCSAASRGALQSGRDIYRAGCVNCHGASGEGAAPSQLHFEPPETFPDFTRCDQTTVESDLTWASIIRNGGPARGFSTIMPAFGDALTARQITAVIAYLQLLRRARLSFGRAEPAQGAGDGKGVPRERAGLERCDQHAVPGVA